MTYRAPGYPYPSFFMHLAEPVVTEDKIYLCGSVAKEATYLGLNSKYVEVWSIDRDNSTLTPVFEKALVTVLFLFMLK